MDKPMTWTTIVEALRVRRKDADLAETNSVKENLGETFGAEYNARGRELTRPSAIAKRSRAAKPIPSVNAN
jgi:hypothetical protein